MSFKYVIKVMIVCCVVSIAALGQQPAQRVYSRADFINVDGGSLTDRIGRAVRQFKDSKAGDSVWLIYQFPINELISIGPFSGNVYHDGDGIRLVRQDNPQGAAVVLLAETTGSQPVFTRVKTLDMSEPYVFEDRPVYWLGSAQADESVSQLDAILRSQPADKVLVRGSLRAIGAHKSGRVVTLLKGYIEKEQEMVDKINRLEHISIEPEYDYSHIKSLSAEARQKLGKIKPRTLGQAARISGVSPADISILMVHMGR